MVPERRATEAPATQMTQVCDTNSLACKDMLGLRTNGVLDAEKIKTWTEAQAQLEALPMRQLFVTLEKLPGFKKGATSAERAVDVVRWLQTRLETPGVWIGVLLMWLIFWFRFTFGAWIMGREEPAEYRFPGPGGQSFVLG